MNLTCYQCKGACCEVFTLVCREETSSPTYYEFARARAVAELPGDRLVFMSKCPRLAGGRCEVYQARPLACQEFPVGSAPCLEIVRMLRPHLAAELEL